MYDEAAQVYSDNRQEIGQLTQGQVKSSELQTADAFRHAYSAAVATNAAAKGFDKMNVFNQEAWSKASLEAGAATVLTAGRGLEYMSLAADGRARGNHADIGMDLHNNSVGAEIAKKAGINATREDLRDAVMNEMAQGNLILTNRDPRATANFNAQPELNAMQTSRDGLIAAAKYASDKLEQVGNAHVTAIAGLSTNGMSKLELPGDTAHAATMKGADTLKALNGAAAGSERPTAATSQDSHNKSQSQSNVAALLNESTKGSAQSQGQSQSQVQSKKAVQAQQTQVEMSHE